MDNKEKTMLCKAYRIEINWQLEGLKDEVVQNRIEEAIDELEDVKGKLRRILELSK